jgi:hypothetical protein
MGKELPYPCGCGLVLFADNGCHHPAGAVEHIDSWIMTSLRQFTRQDDVTV